MKPYLATLKLPAHTAHRGGSLLAPENTLAAFSAAEKYRTDILELDVQPSRDGRVMVIHDETLERTTNGQGPVHALTCAQLQALDAGHHHPAFRGRGVTIPTLDQVLEAFPSLHINIELKSGDDAFMDTFAALIRDHHALDRVCIGAVEEERSLALQQRLPKCAFWYSQDALLRFFMNSREDAPFDPEPVYDVLSVPMEHLGIRVVDDKLIRHAHAQGKQVHVWTVDDAAHMKELLAMGVDSILTDRPDLLRDVLDARA
jgi:glycerophosphoryl diester phosphodiesterase